MQSQIIWGGLLLLLGLVLTTLSLTANHFLLFYGLPLLAVGAVLIIFRGREAIIEEVTDCKDDKK